MSSLRNFLTELFNKQPKSYSKPFLHEPFDINKSIPNYDKWVSSDTHLLVNEEIRKAFESKSEIPRVQSTIQFYISNKLSGFYMDCLSYDLKKQDYLSLMSNGINKLTHLGYITNLSEIQSRNKGENIEESIKIYLKPSRKLVENGKSQQLYGNVIFELISENENLTKFKVSCSYYQDQHFNPPMAFEHFINFCYNE